MTDVIDDENVIALIADVDLTFTPAYTEDPLFEHYGHDPKKFWDECKQWHDTLKQKVTFPAEKYFPEHKRVPEHKQRTGAAYEPTYIDMLLRHIWEGCPETGKKWDGLSRLLLREIGEKIEFFPGLPDAIKEEKDFVKNNKDWQRHDIKLECYAISLGLADMIWGSSIGEHLDGVFAYEVAPGENDNPAEGTIKHMAHPMLYSGKPQHIYQLNKGPLIDVNEKMDHLLRRIPGSRMLYLGDGQTDVPAFAVMKRMEGKSIAVYSPYEQRKYLEAVRLFSEKRVDAIAKADYRNGSPLRLLIREWIARAAEKIVHNDFDEMQKIFLSDNGK